MYRPVGIRRELREAIPMASKRKKRSSAFKARVSLAAVKHERTVKELASRCGVHPNLVYVWKRQLVRGAKEAFTSGAKVAKLESLLLENRDMRARERQSLLFMGHFVLGHVPTKKIKRLLAHRLPPRDFETLLSTVNANSSHRRRHSLIIVFHLCGVPNRLIAEFLGICYRTVNECVLRYARSGVAFLLVPRAGIRKYDDPRYKEMIFSILHSPPKEHGFNRAAWRRRDIHTAAAQVGMPLGRNHIDRIIRDAGYRFRKARVVLTSNDPSYREKVDHIIRILSRLTPAERFFSIDECGPIAVKKQGGRRLFGPGEEAIVPRFQVSKGSLIITAALELSTNQVSHFYSTGKNTVEMIKLLNLLLEQYRKCSKLYLSWDAAGWHASKRFLARVAEVNNKKYRLANGTPRIELAPLPSRAQFLNVIESVFNGLATSVIHNSDYASVDEAKAAIDRHFAERNAYFRKNPRRAGGKIWGKERVSPAFKEGQNCKNPNYR
jgi:transposase-like protein/transposase